MITAPSKSYIPYSLSVAFIFDFRLWDSNIILTGKFTLLKLRTFYPSLSIPLQLVWVVSPDVRGSQHLILERYATRATTTPKPVNIFGYLDYLDIK